MRFLVAVALTALIAGPSVAADRDTERIVTRHVASIVPPDGAGGVAVALRIEGRSLFFSCRGLNQVGACACSLVGFRRMLRTHTLARRGGLGRDYDIIGSADWIAMSSF